MVCWAMKKEEVDGLVTKANPSLTPSGLSRPLSGMLRPSAPPTSVVREAERRSAARAAEAADTGGGDISVQRREMCAPPHFDLH